MEVLLGLAGTTWKGTNELWLDPLGDEVDRSEGTIQLDESTVRYTWLREGTTHSGKIELREDGADFTDSWHQTEVMVCRRLPVVRGFFHVEGAYGPQADWAWRISLSQRPSGQLVLQMTNIAPWGEEARAVRLTCTQI